MPRTVTAGRAQSMSDTLPSPSSADAVEHAGVAPELLGRVGLAGPGLGVVQARDRGVALLVAQRWPASRSAPRVRRARRRRTCRSAARTRAPRTVTTTLIMPRRLTVAAGRPTAALPVSQTRIASARSRSASLGHEGLEPAGALLLRPLDDELEVHGNVVAQGPQRREVHDDVALAVGGAAAVPAPVDLGQLERRCAPGVLVERWLHVVVGVQQHRRGVGVGAWPRPDDGLAAVRGLDEVGVGEAELGELVEHPLGGLVALLRRVLPGVGHRREWRRARRAPPGPGASARRCAR